MGSGAYIRLGGRRPGHCRGGGPPAPAAADAAAWAVAHGWCIEARRGRPSISRRSGQRGPRPSTPALRSWRRRGEPQRMGGRRPGGGWGRRLWVGQKGDCGRAWERNQGFLSSVERSRSDLLPLISCLSPKIVSAGVIAIHELFMYACKDAWCTSY
jgi:hypothetical protein